MLNHKEKVILTSDYVDEFNHQYRRGQVGVVRGLINVEDEKAMVFFDGYGKEKQRAKKMQEKCGEGPNIVEYLADIPVNILIKA